MVPVPPLQCHDTIAQRMPLYFQSEHCNYRIIKDYCTTERLLVGPLKHFKARSLSKREQKMHKNFEIQNFLGLL